MNTDLIDLIKRNTLKSQIQSTISKNKLSAFGKLLKNTLKTNFANQFAPKDMGLKSETTDIKSQCGSPVFNQTPAIDKIDNPANQNCKDHHKSKSRLKAKPANNNPKLKQHTSKSKSRSKEKIRSLILIKSNLPPSNLCKSISKSGFLNSCKQKQSNSKQKGLSSIKNTKKISVNQSQQIIQQQSLNKKLLTPLNKKYDFNAKDNHQITKKKEKCQRFTENFKQKLLKSFKQVEKFQRLFKTEAIALGYRITNNKLIEIEISAIKKVSSLKISLVKGNIECQNIEEQFKNISASTFLSLFSSVRSFNFVQIDEFPRILIEAEVDQHQKIEQAIIIPYTWLHFVENKPPSISKSKIKTKICLDGLTVNSVKLQFLSVIFRIWCKRDLNGYQQFETTFFFEQQQFTLKLSEQQNKTFSLQLQGKGQQRLTKMVNFLHDLIS